MPLVTIVCVPYGGQRKSGNPLFIGFPLVFFKGGRWDSNPRHSEPQTETDTHVIS